MNIILKASNFAYKMHKDDVRKYTGRPYFIHVASVAGRVAGWSDDENIVASAFLHDVVEDHPEITFDYIEKEFNHKIRDGVFFLTSYSKTNKIQAPREERKRLDRQFYAYVPKIYQRVKLEDKNCNLEDLLVDCNDDEFLELYANEANALLPFIKGGDLATAKYIEILISDILNKVCRLRG